MVDALSLWIENHVYEFTTGDNILPMAKEFIRTQLMTYDAPASTEMLKYLDEQRVRINEFILKNIQ